MASAFRCGALLPLLPLLVVVARNAESAGEEGPGTVWIPPDDYRNPDEDLGVDGKLRVIACAAGLFVLLGFAVHLRTTFRLGARSGSSAYMLASGADPLIQSADAGEEPPTESFEPVLQVPACRPGADLVELMPRCQGCAIYTPGALPDGLSHGALRSLLEENIGVLATLSSEACVAVALPPGPSLAVSLLVVMSRTRCAPLEPGLSSWGAASSLRRLGATCAVLPAGGDAAQHGAGIREAAAQLDLRVLELQLPSHGGARGDRRHWGGRSSAEELISAFRGMTAFGRAAPPEQQGGGRTRAADVALLLQTSGTTGVPKVVPQRLGDLADGSQRIAASLALGPEDACLNMLPLFHIGGIASNLLAPLLSGGKMLCADLSFTPQVFVALLEETTRDRQLPTPTWFYASPSMHLAIAEHYDKLGRAPHHALRLVRSASAALAPALQLRLEALWGCPAVPTYGMSECMPICSPIIPADSAGLRSTTQVAPLGSVGRVVGPSVTTRNGEVVCKGGPLFAGYLGAAAEEGWTADGWFRTGDLGRFDAQGHLRITGRSKEVINRGGETIAPNELEGLLLNVGQRQQKADLHGRSLAEGYQGMPDSLPTVAEVCVFAVPHQRLGETVGVCAVLDESAGDALAGLHEFEELVAAWASRFESSKRPQLVAFVDCLPKTATGKVQRSKLFQSLCGEVPEELTGEEAGVVLLDARGTGTELRCRSLGEAEVCRGDGEMAADSLGVMRKKTAADELEMAVIYRCYCFWALGVLIDHFCECKLIYSYSEDKNGGETWTLLPFCYAIARTSVPSWVELVLRSIGNVQLLFGFTLVLSYQDSRPDSHIGTITVGGSALPPRIRLGMRDVIVFAVYLAMAFPLPHMLYGIFGDWIWRDDWYGGPFGGVDWDYMSCTTWIVAGHRWFLYMMLQSRVLLWAGEKMRVPGWLQVTFWFAVCLFYPQHYAGDMCVNEELWMPVRWTLMWVFGSGGEDCGQCPIYARWVMLFSAFYVASFHYLRRFMALVGPRLPKGPVWSVVALGCSCCIGLTMAAFHYPDSSLEGENDHVPPAWAALEVISASVQPMLLALGMTHVPLNMSMWGTRTLGCYMIHFYFSDQYTVAIVWVIEALAWDRTGLVILFGILGCALVWLLLIGPLWYGTMKLAYTAVASLRRWARPAGDFSELNSASYADDASTSEPSEGSGTDASSLLGDVSRKFKCLV